MKQLALAVLALAACGGMGYMSSSPPTDPTPTTPGSETTTSRSLVDAVPVVVEAMGARGFSVFGAERTPAGLVLYFTGTDLAVAGAEIRARFDGLTANITLVGMDAVRSFASPSQCIGPRCRAYEPLTGWEACPKCNDVITDVIAKLDAPPAPKKATPASRAVRPQATSSR
jgi:hypothetical protein